MNTWQAHKFWKPNSKDLNENRRPRPFCLRRQLTTFETNYLVYIG